MNARHDAPLGRQPIARDAFVRELLRPYEPYLSMPGVNEISVNRPQELWTLNGKSWSRHDVPELTFEHTRQLAGGVATYTSQFVNDTAPLLSAALPDGQRIQFALPPATLSGIAGIGIRIPHTAILRTSDFAKGGFFSRVGQRRTTLFAWEQELLELKRQGDYLQFVNRCMQHELTMVIAGQTNTGKTSFMKALAEEIPTTRRILTIQDALEMELPSHPNKLHLMFSKGGQGSADVSPKALLQACNRLNPDWILLTELRADEAYSFLRLASSGHPGLTSLHAGSCEQAFDQLALMVRESSAGGGMTMADIRRMAEDVVDVVIHIEFDDIRYITEVHYDPERRLRAAA